MKDFINKLDEAQKLYEKKFNDVFPTFSFMGTEPDELIQMINECIAADKDAYDIGYVSLDAMY